MKSTTDIALLILRIGTGAMMLTHGLPKLTKFFGEEPIAFANVLGIGPEFSLGLAVFAEVICSIFILVGFRTRLASIPLLVTMVVAVFVIHAGDPFGQQEMGLHYLMSYLVLILMGGGRFSLDAILAYRKEGQQPHVLSSRPRLRI